MPLLEHNTAIKLYWEQEKHKYPDMSFEEFELVCKSPFQAIKEWIKDPVMPFILIKYLGKLRVFPSKIKSMMRYNQIILKPRISAEEYNSKQAYLEQYLKDLELEEQEDEVEISD